MHSRLTVIVAQQHIADLRRAADNHRRAQAATTAESPTNTASSSARGASARRFAAPASSPCERSLNKCSAARQ
jgi:hypothetical protein